MGLPIILLGRSDFATLRQDGGLYVDKSGFVSAVLAAGADVQLHPRPRRFGKTLNLGDQDLWSLLLFSGYLRIDSHDVNEWGQRHALLSIPNR